MKQALQQAIGRLPKVDGTPGEVHVSRELTALLNVADKLAQKRGDQFIASELFILAALDARCALADILKQAGAKDIIEYPLNKVIP